MSVEELPIALKGEVVRCLSSFAPLLALVPEQSIFAMTIPAMPKWPFVRYGSPIITPYEMSCGRGIDARVTIHAFAETTATRAGEDAAQLIAARVVSALAEFTPAGMSVVSCDFLGDRLIVEDAESSRWHAIVEFRIIVILEN